VGNRRDSRQNDDPFGRSGADTVFHGNWYKDKNPVMEGTISAASGCTVKPTKVRRVTRRAL
jgi:hypothetical protein